MRAANIKAEQTMSVTAKDFNDLIVDDKTRGIFRVHRSAFMAQTVFEMERRRVFERSWLYLAHASEVAAPGNFDLVAVPKLAEFRGFVFVHFDAGAKPLEDYLEGACEYLDLVASASAEQMIVVGETHEYACRANWKLSMRTAPTATTHWRPIRPTSTTSRRATRVVHRFSCRRNSSAA